jgi:hypothetical protein
MTSGVRIRRLAVRYQADDPKRADHKGADPDQEAVIGAHLAPTPCLLRCISGFAA